MLSYVMTGGFRAGGHAPDRWTKNIITKFRRTDVAYSRYAAGRGGLEAVAIRDTIIRTGVDVTGPAWYTVFYTDNLHTEWQEKDLLTHEEALYAIQRYWLAVEADAYRGQVQRG